MSADTFLCAVGKVCNISVGVTSVSPVYVGNALLEVICALTAPAPPTLATIRGVKIVAVTLFAIAIPRFRDYGLFYGYNFFGRVANVRSLFYAHLEKCRFAHIAGLFFGQREQIRFGIEPSRVR